MTVDEAEKVLSELDPKALRPVLSRLASNTPGIVYFPDDMTESIAKLPPIEDSQMTRLGQALLMVVCTVEDRIGVGETLTATFGSARHGARDIGDWEVALTKLEDAE